MTTCAPLARLSALFAATAAAWLALAFPAATASAQTTVTLDGTSGSESISTSYTVDNGGLEIDLAFYVEYLVVGGGGAGGSTDAGGGGAGAVASNFGGTPLRITSSSSTITVGNGGARSTVNWTRGGNGGLSEAFGVQAAGGGGGGSGSGANTTNQTSGSGASSGGLGSTITDPARLGTASAGTQGGIGAATRGGGGGGGAGAVGQAGSGSTAGNGGFGVQNAITGTAIYYGDGGGGGHGSSNTTTGGSGRGGAGNPSGNGGNGQANSGSGGGGGGASFGQGGNGGSGIVVIRYAGDATGITGGSTDTSTAVGEAITTFTTSGTFTIDFATRPGVTLTSPVTGTGDFAFAGPGRLTLAAANTFAGTARIGDGTLSLGDVAALQNATLDMNAADVGTAAFAVAGSNTYALAGLTGSRTLALGGNSLSIGGTGATSDYSGVLSGTGGLTKAGAGQLTLSGANLYTGATAIDAGTLKLSSTNTSSSYAIASGAVLEIGVATGPTTFTGGTYTGSGTLRKTGPGRIRWSGATDFSLDASATIDVQEGALQASTAANQPWANNQASLNVAAGALFDVDAAAVRVGGLTGSGTVVLGLATVATFPLQKLTVGVADATSEFAGVIQNGTGTAPLEKIGTGTITLTGGNTYTGTTTISTGTLAVGKGGTTGTLGGGAVVNNATLEFDRSNDLTVANVISGTGTVIKNGAGVTTLSARNTYTGGTTITAGTLRLTDVHDSASYAIAAGSVLELASDGDLFFGGGTYSGSGILRKTGSGELQWRTAGGVVPAINLDASATIDVQAGRLQASYAANQIWANNQSTLNVAAGAEFAVDAADARFSGLTGSGTVTLGLSPAGTYPDQKLTVGVADATSEFAGVIRNGTGTAPFEKIGTGTLTLSGTSTFTGDTTITAGRLAVNGALGNTAVTVATAAELGGTGSIAGTVAVSTGGRLAPGNSIGVLTEGATSFASGATFEYEVDSSDLGNLGSAADLLVVNGNLDIASGTLLEFSDLAAQSKAFVEDSTVFAMINYTGDWNQGLFTYNGQSLADGSRFFVGSQLWEIDYDYAYTGSNTQPLNWQGSYVPASGTQTFVTVTAVPEPTTLALVAAGLGLAALARRRK